MPELTYVDPDQFLIDSFLLGRKVYLSGFRPKHAISIWRGGTPVGLGVDAFYRSRGLHIQHTTIATDSYQGISQQGEVIVKNLEHLVQVICPEPVPITVSPIAMLNNSPNKNGARLFINWILSREGQLLQYYKSYVIPAHKDLDQPRFNSVFDLVKGKKKSVRDDALLGSEIHKKMLKMWNANWTNPVGKGRKKKGRKKKKKQ